MIKKALKRKSEKSKKVPTRITNDTVWRVVVSTSTQFNTPGTGWCGTLYSLDLEQQS